jgi:hypothetical protein
MSAEAVRRTPGPGRPLLAICVPTYNRAADLISLLSCLDREIGDRENVVVLVSDNASDDETAAVLAAAVGPDRPWLSIHRQPENLGANRNLRWLVLNAPDCEYLWLFGDDDLLVEGGLAAVIDLLESERPRWLLLPHRWPAHDDVRGRVFPAPGAVERHATGADLWRGYDHWLTFVTATVMQAGALRRAVADRWTDTGYQPLLWFFAAGMPGPCVVAPHNAIDAGAETTWADRMIEILTRDFTALYDEGLHEGMTAAEFAVTLDGLYRRDHDMTHIWRKAPLELLVERVGRFPQSEALRGFLWILAQEGGRADVIPDLREALRTVGADVEAQALVADGERAFAAGDLVAAVRCFDEATRRDPTCVGAWNDLAVVLAAADRHAMRDVALGHALFVGPDDVDALVNRSTVLADAGDHAAAREHLERALTHDPHSIEAAALLAAIDRLAA